MHVRALNSASVTSSTPLPSEFHLSENSLLFSPTVRLSWGEATDWLTEDVVCGDSFGMRWWMWRNVWQHEVLIHFPLHIFIIAHNGAQESRWSAENATKTQSWLTVLWRTESISQSLDLTGTGNGFFFIQKRSGNTKKQASCGKNVVPIAFYSPLVLLECNYLEQAQIFYYVWIR